MLHITLDTHILVELEAKNSYNFIRLKMVKRQNQ